MQSQSSCIKLLRGFHCLVSPEDLDAASTQYDTEHSAWLLYSVLDKNALCSNGMSHITRQNNYSNSSSML